MESGCAVGCDAEVEVFVEQVDVKAVSELGHAAADIGFVEVVDDTVAVAVHEDYVAGLDVGLQDAEACFAPCVNLILVLEYAVGLVAPEVAYGLAVFGAVEFRRVVVQLVCRTMDNSVLGGDGAYFVPVVCSVDADAVREVVADDVVPCDAEFDTGVLHVAAVDERCVCAGGSENRCHYEPVLGSLLVPVEVDAQTVLEKCGVEAEVKLLGGLPGDVEVAQAARECAPVVAEDGGVVAVAAVGTEVLAEEIVGVGHLDGSEVLVVVDVLVAHTAPAAAYFQEVEPGAAAFHEFFVAEVPACGNRGECAEAVAGSELRGTVGTEGHVNHVFLLPVPADTSEVADGSGVVVGVAAGAESVGGVCGGAVVHPCKWP